MPNYGISSVILKYSESYLTNTVILATCVMFEFPNLTRRPLPCFLIQSFFYALTSQVTGFIELENTLLLYLKIFVKDKVKKCSPFRPELLRTPYLSVKSVKRFGLILTVNLFLLRDKFCNVAKITSQQAVSVMPNKALTNRKALWPRNKPIGIKIWRQWHEFYLVW